MIKFAIAAGLTTASLALAPIATAGPNMSCQAALSWQQAHNAAGSNVDTHSHAAVDAYNAEADAIDATIADACSHN